MGRSAKREMFITPSPIGVEVGGEVPKNFFPRNWIKCADLQHKNACNLQPWGWVMEVGVKYQIFFF